MNLIMISLNNMDKIEAQGATNLKPDSLTCQPRVFSPKGVAGQLVEWIAQQQTFGPGKQAIRWDGQDSDGEVVATGLYIVTVTVGDQTQDKLVNVWNH